MKRLLTLTIVAFIGMALCGGVNATAQDSFDDQVSMKKAEGVGLGGLAVCARLRGIDCFQA